MTTSAGPRTGDAATLSGRIPAEGKRAIPPRRVPEILREGAVAHGPSMVLRALPSAGGAQRRAVVVSRKLGGAVTRNRAKRRLREAMRMAQLSEALDTVVIARAAALLTPMTQLTRELQDLCQRVEKRQVPGAQA